MADPLILFTGLPGAGVSTRLTALRVALSHDVGFRAYEVDREGRQINQEERISEFELLDMIALHEGARSSAVSPPFRLGIEAGTHRGYIEVWEQSFDAAVSGLERAEYEFDGIVVSLSIHSRCSAEDVRRLNALIRPLRTRYWIDVRERKAPWIFIDLTCYETLFCQLVPEMLPEIRTDGAAAPSTPRWLAERREVQELAIRSFCQSWRGDNEFTHLANAERQRCAGPFQRRVVIQVSSAWGFLVGNTGPAAREPANCRHPAEAEAASYCPRFPRFKPTEKGALTTLKLGVPVTSIPDGAEIGRQVEHEARTFFRIWKPIGVVEPIPSVVWNRPAPNMFWVPEVMSSMPGSA
ncbi:hypothetical protein BRADO0814 [Bradyrhizobium sp. ORS 278]|uniref:hypothetical protein n=1 Tax=Bradyrhizobium sp. (strain ORS 278) TaxID=114615 RepID=UPI00015078ED|nr:hypothetical protein [Bradyrhizobium sp. ORS 278]CAL74736.1 hypothetical protein BRADO0814 [Bradyrhizobium sp. ORS 278]